MVAAISHDTQRGAETGSADLGQCTLVCRQSISAQSRSLSAAVHKAIPRGAAGVWPTAMALSNNLGRMKVMVEFVTGSWVGSLGT